MNQPPGYDLRRVPLSATVGLFERFHGYGGVGSVSTYCFAVIEEGQMVAAFVWSPPMIGAAASVSPSAPWAALALSRMVATPRNERRLNHISKPLRRQMRSLIDRGRWPVLVTYSDASMGHTGHVYKCSGWQEDGTRRCPVFKDPDGVKRSSWANGESRADKVTRTGSADLTRWVHLACAKGEEKSWCNNHGWERVPIPGKTWPVEDRHTG